MGVRVGVIKCCSGYIKEALLMQTDLDRDTLTVKSCQLVDNKKYESTIKSK